MNKKGQITLGDAPQVVLIVGFTFLIMATMAFIAVKYGAAMPSDESATLRNETLLNVTEAGKTVSGTANCNFEDFTIITVQNRTGGSVIQSGNYTTTSAGVIKFTGADTKWNNTAWNVTYSYSYAGTACNITNDLQTEIKNNTSIAGIVLTISLIGIVLAVLIGVFVLARNRGM